MDFRVKRTQEDIDFNGKYEWDVQFRNRYADAISFDYKIVNPGDNGATIQRQTVNANGTSNGDDWFLITNPSECQVLVDKVRFGDDDDKPYYPCGGIYSSNPTGNSSNNNNSPRTTTTTVTTTTNQSEASPQAENPVPAVNNNATTSQANNTTNTVNNTTSPPVINTTRLTAQQRLTQQYINNVQNTSGDAVQQALSVKLAGIQANVRGGSTLQQQQQIQQLQQQQQAQQTTSTVEATTQLAGGVANLVSAIANGNRAEKDAEQRVRDESRDRNIQRLLASGTAHDYYMAGFIYSFYKNDYNSALICYKKAADMGDPEALDAAIDLYKSGKLKNDDDFYNLYLRKKATYQGGEDTLLGDYETGKTITDYNFEQPESALSYYYNIVYACSNRVFSFIDFYKSYYAFIAAGQQGSIHECTDQNDYEVYIKALYEIGKIYSVWGEDGKTEKQSLIDAEASFNKSLDLINAAPKLKTGNNNQQSIDTYTERLDGENFKALTKRIKKLKDDGPIVQPNANNAVIVPAAAIGNKMMGYYNKALLENKQGDYTGAINDFTTAISLAPDISIIYYHRANSYLNIQQFNQAKSDCDMAINLYRDSADYYFLRGFINYTYLHDNAGALSDLTWADRLRPGNAAILDLKSEVTKTVNANDYFNRGVTAFNAGNYAEAIKDLNLSIEQDPKVFTPYLYRGATEIQLFQRQAAIKDFTKAIAVTPNNPGAHVERAEVYYLIGEPQRGINDLDTALAITINNDAIADILVRRAAFEYILHQYQRVIDDCNASIARVPGFAYTYVLRGKTYLKKLQNRDAAMQDFTKALQLDTSKTSDTFIYSSFYTGNADKAVQSMQHSLSLAKTPFNITNASYDMACVLSLAGRRVEAVVYLKKAVAGGVEKKYIIYDDDLDNIRNTPGYISLIGAKKWSDRHNIISKNPHK